MSKKIYSVILVMLLVAVVIFGVGFYSLRELVVTNDEVDIISKRTLELATMVQISYRRRGQAQPRSRRSAVHQGMGQNRRDRVYGSSRWPGRRSVRRPMHWRQSPLSVIRRIEANLSRRLERRSGQTEERRPHAQPASQNQRQDQRQNQPKMDNGEGRSAPLLGLHGSAKRKNTCIIGFALPQQAGSVDPACCHGAEPLP